MKNCENSCLKVNNPIRNLLLPVIIFLVVDKLIGYAFYMSLFKDVWVNYETMWRPMNDQKHWCYGMTGAAAFYALFISLFYVKISNLAKKQICLFGFAFAIFIIGRFIGEVYNYLMYPYDMKVMALGMAHGFCVLMLWALISKKIFIIKTNNL